MSAARYADSPVDHRSSHAATRSHCFIETSGEINMFMKMHVVNLAERGLRQSNKCFSGARITAMSLAYKSTSTPPGVAHHHVHRGARPPRSHLRSYPPFAPSPRDKGRRVCLGRERQGGRFSGWSARSSS